MRSTATRQSLEKPGRGGDWPSFVYPRRGRGAKIRATTSCDSAFETITLECGTAKEGSVAAAFNRGEGNVCSTPSTIEVSPPYS